ncbi:hypothetical protein Q1695_012589 [Nippostrongylus brasiliensis]|nr:hypothetical protein Q1695_012589 [Nippostrongylus brasiliensis]
MKLSTVQQLTLIAVVTAFLCAPGQAFQPHPQCENPDATDGVVTGNPVPLMESEEPPREDNYKDWRELKMEDFGRRARPGIRMKVFNQTQMNHNDAKELCKKNKGVLADVSDLLLDKIHEFFPLEAHVVHKDQCGILIAESGLAMYGDCDAKADHAVCEGPSYY